MDLPQQTDGRFVGVISARYVPAFGPPEETVWLPKTRHALFPVLWPSDAGTQQVATGGISAQISHKSALRQTASNSMIRLMMAQIRVWIECPTCGPCQKFEREIALLLEVITPVLEKACAVCDRCRGSALTYFERKPGRLH
jgi:hypothetical protein